MTNNHTTSGRAARLGSRMAEFLTVRPRFLTRPGRHGGTIAPTAPGGLLGVDVFFVVSGLLITTRLLREQRRAERIDLRSFWRRRARRLLPALAFMCVTSIVAAMLVNRDLLVDVDRQALGAATFSTNWLEIAAGTDYFADRDPSLFNLLWPLAVEEQFYLFRPVAFTALAASTATPRQLARLLHVVALGSAAWMAQRCTPAAATRVYYGTDTHLFGLMIGCSLAYAFRDPASRLARAGWPALHRWIGFAATATLLVVCVALDDATSATYRGGILTASVCTALMVAALPGPATAYTRLLDAPPTPSPRSSWSRPPSGSVRSPCDGSRPRSGSPGSGRYVVGIATAPDRSAAEESVEAGLRLIERQRTASPAN